MYESHFREADLTPELLLNLAESLGKTGRYEEMEGTLVQLLRRSPSAIAHERLGSARFRLKRYDEALGSFREATRADERHYPAWNGVAVCLLNRYLWSGKKDLDALDEAIDAMRRSLRIERRQPRIIERCSRRSRRRSTPRSWSSTSPRSSRACAR